MRRRCAGLGLLAAGLFLLTGFLAKATFAEKVLMERSFCGDAVSKDPVKIVLDDEVLAKSDIDFAEPESIRNHCFLKITGRFKTREGAFRTEFYYVNPQGETVHIKTKSEYPRAYDEEDNSVIWFSRAGAPWNLAIVRWDPSANRWRK